MARNVKISGGGKLKAALANLSQKVKDGAHVRVGYLEGATYDDEKHTPVAQVAAWDEFGTATAPPRPFMRPTIAQHQDGWGKALGSALNQTDFDVDRALAGTGAIMASQIVDQIDATTSPANAPLTNLLKDRFPKGDYTRDDFLKAVHDLAAGAQAPLGQPLNWSGRMRNSVSYEVKPSSEEG